MLSYISLYRCNIQRFQNVHFLLSLYWRSIDFEIGLFFGSEVENDIFLSIFSHEPFYMELEYKHLSDNKILIYHSNILALMLKFWNILGNFKLMFYCYIFMFKTCGKSCSLNKTGLWKASLCANLYLNWFLIRNKLRMLSI